MAPAVVSSARRDRPVHIEIFAGGWNADDGTTGKKEVDFFFSGTLTTSTIIGGHHIKKGRIRHANGSIRRSGALPWPSLLASFLTGKYHVG